MGKVKAGKADRRRSLGIREIDRLELRKQRDDPFGLPYCFSYSVRNISLCFMHFHLLI